MPDQTTSSRYNQLLGPSVLNPYTGYKAPIKLSFPDHFSNLLKESYNKSIWGLTDHLVNQKQRYDLSEFQYGAVFDITASILGFGMDLPAYVAGGGIGTATLKTAGVQFAGKQAVKRAALRKQAAQGIDDAARIVANNGAKPSYVSKARDQLKKTFIENGERLVFDSSGFALVSGTHEYLNQKITKDDVDWAKVMNKSLVGLATFPAGKLGGIATTSAVKGKVPTAIARVGGEATGFMAPYSWEQGKLLPSPEDIAVTGGILGGAQLLTRGYGGIVKNQQKLIDETNKVFGNKGSFKFSEAPKDIKKAAGEELKRRGAGNFAQRRTLYDKDGNQIFVEKFTDSRGMVKFRDNKTGQVKRMPEKDFYNNYSIENSIKTPRFELVKSIGRQLDELGMYKVDDIRKILFSIRGGRVPKNLKEGDRGFSSLTNRELYHLNKKLSNKNMLNDIAKEMMVLDKQLTRTYLPGPFGMLGKAFDRLTLDMFPKALSWIRSTEAKLSRPGVSVEAKYMGAKVENHATLQGSIVSHFLDRMRQAGILKKLNDKEAMKNITAELEMNVGRNSTMSDGARAIRQIYDDMYAMFKEEGIDVVGFEQAYAARFIKDDLANALKDIRLSIMKEAPEIFSGVQNLTKDPKTRKFLDKKIDSILKEYKDNKSVVSYFKSVRDYYKGDSVRVFNDLDMHLMQQATRPFNNITKTRTGNISWVPELNRYSIDIFETNAGLNVLNYLRQGANKIATKRYFGENFDDAIKLIDDIERGVVGRPDRMTAETLKEVVARVSGIIEMDPYRNFRNKDFVKKMVDFQIGTKIGGGLATLVNITQPLISSLLLGNYRIGIPSYMKYFVSGSRKETLNKMGLHKDTEFLKTIEVLAGVTRRGNSASDKALDWVLKATGFTGINRINLGTSASIGVDMMKYLNRVANGESVMLRGLPLSKKVKDSIINDTLAGQSRQAWAKNKLYRDYGVVWKGRKELNFEELSRGAIKFSKDTQLQRNLMKEPLFLTEPMFRPLLILKTFGIKQAKLIKTGLNRELSEGNVLPVLRLGVGAGIGGKFIINSYELIQNIISGKDEYDWRQSKLGPTGEFDKDANILEKIGTQYGGMRPGFFGGEKNYKRGDYWKDLLTPTIEEIAAVGSLGVVSDFMAADNQMQAVKWAVQPVIWNDITSVYSTWTELNEDIDDFGVSGAMKRSPQNFVKIFGSNAKRVAARFETPGHMEARIKSQKGRVNRRIVELCYKGKREEARRMIISWNKAHPDQPILEPNVEAIYKYLYEREQRRQNP